MSEKKLIVVALGGNAILQAEEKGTVWEQLKNVEHTCEELIKLNRMNYKIILTHGNGPQVGTLLSQQEETAAIIPAQPLDVVGAMTQGQIGYMFQSTLHNYFLSVGKDIPVATVVTQVIVDQNDPDFQNPSKPVGSFFTEETALQMKREKGWLVKEVKPDGPRNWRRVVPSPEPKGIVEIDVIHALLDAHVIVVASGGGGVPVVKNEAGEVHGIEGVVDKDKAGHILAQELSANIYMILTDVQSAFLNFGKSDQKPIGEITVSEMEALLKEGHFLQGSMGPKIEAGIRFVRGGGEMSIITSIDNTTRALRGECGTIILPDHPRGSTL